MELKNKKTVLTDDASIYNHEENPSEREKWKNLHGKQKLEYFKNYYLMKLIVLILGSALVISLLVTIFTPKPDTVFFAAVINSSLSDSQIEVVKQQYEELICLDETKQETVFDTGYYFGTMDYESLSKFATYNAVGQIDVTIMPLSVFETYAPNNYFIPVSQVLPTDLYLELSPYLVECGIKDESGNIDPDSVTMYGIRIDSSYVYEGVTTSEPIILAINANDKHLDNVVEFLKYLFAQ